MHYELLSCMISQKKILWQLLPGFIPLFIFIVADEIWGTKIGLAVAIAFGFIELAYYWVKDRKFDKFILFDTLLIILLGLISIVLDNDIFFKLKPAFIGLIMCLFLGISVFTPSQILLNMTKRYLRGVEMNEQQHLLMRQNMKIMFWLVVVYTALVFYSVWFMSTQAWAFISGTLLYIIFGAYLLVEIIKNRIKRMNYNKEEWLPLLNEQGEVIGKAPRSVCHSSKEYLHPVVHLHVINSQGDIYLQKRPMHKIQPGKWDTSVGGHVAFGEDIETALRREASEEIGLNSFKADLAANYIWESDIEREFVFSFVTHFNGQLNIDKEELADGRFWTVAEIKANLGKGVFTPNFEVEFNKILPNLGKKKNK
jgi:isopentenyldiphosphate isomerase/intracellular septation protein A